MKQKWSVKWVASKQVRKQRKYRHNAPFHVRHNFLSAHLSKDLRKQYERRSFPLRKGDEIEVMNGKFKGTKGAIERVDMKELKVYVDGIKVKKTDGREVVIALEPSNLKIIRFDLSDKRRQKSLHKGKKIKEPEQAMKPGTKKEHEKKSIVPKKETEEQPSKKKETIEDKEIDKKKRVDNEEKLGDKKIKETT